MPAASRASEATPTAESRASITQNGKAVKQDHAHYRDAARGYRDPKPLFEVALAQSYELMPHPVEEGAVTTMTQKAVTALREERDQAGGRPLETAAIVPEPEFVVAVEDASTDSEVLIETPADPPPPPPLPPGPVDIQALAQYLEAQLGAPIRHRINQIDGALAGLGYRLKVVSDQLAALPTSPHPSEASAPTQQPVAAAAESVPAPQGLDGLSLSERRNQRRNPAAPGPVPVPGKPQPAGTRPAAPRPQDGEPSGSRFPWRALGIAATFLIVGLLAAQTIRTNREESRTASARLVERQAQGYGAYVRTEERALKASIRAGSSEELVKARMDFNASVGTEAREAAYQRVQALQGAADRGERAQQALRVLRDVSGITPETVAAL